jgi:hypothetical protein
MDEISSSFLVLRASLTETKGQVEVKVEVE